eukprot:TRINITY_DN916_c0_g1_i1.p1 TRINITY_DN916_c0_g1~~TRINITY_DN916_c0_g1_i1.p1  ORF type:complete len:1123 (+),score=543.93 TRINITY_DN916_c0_g1_i1:96-3464(+)
MSRRRDWGAGDFGSASTVPGVPKGSESDVVSGWHICENEVPRGKTNHVNEALFALSNGYLGVRGTFEEGYFGGPDESGAIPSEQGIFVNGFYEDHVIKYPEVGYGQAEKESVMLNVTNSKIVKVEVDGESFDMWAHDGKIQSYSRELHLRDGTLRRDVVWTSPSGKKIGVRTLRLVPLAPSRKHIYVQELEVTPLSDNIKTITVKSCMDAHVTNKPQSKDPRVGAGFSGQVLHCVERAERHSHEGFSFSYIKSKTTLSQLTLMCSMFNTCVTRGAEVPSEIALENEQMISEVFTVDVSGKTGKPIKLTKVVSYTTTQMGGCLEEELPVVAAESLKSAVDAGVDALVDEQGAFLGEFYETADIIVNGDDHLQQGLRFNIFHLVQAVGRDGFTNIGAKGISGEGYCGHYFWDTEIYILPFFLYTKPDFARKLVEFRIKLLDKARMRAKQLGGITKGALFPWRTIYGEECSSYFPAGTAQLHINADVAWAFKQYMEATDDIPILLEGGAEMIIEMARFWMQYGNFGQGGHFQINCVTGPDEYTCLVNNNYYTNIMVQDALNYVVETCYMLKHEYPEAWNNLVKKIDLQDCEITQMGEAADKMYLPYDKPLGVHPQDDSFLQKKGWDFENTPADKYPLLMNYHYLIIYKYKVIKQADLVLALLLQGDHFTDKEKKLNYDYYEPLTTHDSSLSTAVYSVMAAEIGYYQKAYNYFSCTARMDLDNIHHNSQHGIHTACMAGTWMCVVRGFAGLRIKKNVLHLNPYLPQEWKGYRFSVAFHGAVLQIEVGARTVAYKCVKGARINFVHADTQKIYLKAGKTKELLLRDKFEDLTSLSFDSVVIDIDAALPRIQMDHFESWRAAIAQVMSDNKASVKAGCPEFSLVHYKKYLQNQISQMSRFDGLKQYLQFVLTTELPIGSSHDPPGTCSLWAVGNLKTEILRKVLDDHPPKPSEHFVRLVKGLRAEGIKIGLVSYSKSGETLLEKSGLKMYIEAYVTGTDMGQLGLRGKPHMDMYQRVVEQLFTDAKRCIVIIDDPVGFDREELARFKYSISAPFTAQLLKTEGFDLKELEAQHLELGINQVVPNLEEEEFDIDLFDAKVAAVEKSESYESRMERMKQRRMSGVFTVNK